MPRYFFDLRDGVVIPDEVGAELDGLKAVKRVAGQKMAAILDGCHGRAWMGDDWSITVRTESGAVALIVTLVATETGALA